MEPDHSLSSRDTLRDLAFLGTSQSSSLLGILCPPTAKMAMASCVLSCSFSSLALASTVSSSASSVRSSSSSYLAGGRFIIAPVTLGRIQNAARRNAVIKVAAAAAEGAVPEVVAEPAVEAPSNPVSELKLQSDILKKIAKKEELKRKRLVRKRHLRKKGRWPPSKLKKNQNV